MAVEVGSASREVFPEVGSQDNPIVVDDSWVDIDDLFTEASQLKGETPCEAIPDGRGPLPTNGQSTVEETSSRCQSHDAKDEIRRTPGAVNTKPQQSQDEQDMDLGTGTHAHAQATSSGSEGADTGCKKLQMQQQGDAEQVQQRTPKRNRTVEDSQDEDNASSNHGSDTDMSGAEDDGKDSHSDSNNNEGSGITSPRKKRSRLDPLGTPGNSSANRSKHDMQTLREPARTPSGGSESGGTNSPSPAAAEHLAPVEPGPLVCRCSYCNSQIPEDEIKTVRGGCGHVFCSGCISRFSKESIMQACDVRSCGHTGYALLRELRGEIVLCKLCRQKKGTRAACPRCGTAMFCKACARTCHEMGIELCLCPSDEAGRYITMPVKAVAEWEVEKIVGRRILRDKRGSKNTEYKIRWLGWGPEHDQWVGGKGLAGCKQMVKEYMASRRRRVSIV